MISGSSIGPAGRSLRSLFLAGLAAGWAAYAAPAAAANADWKEASYEYIVLDQDLRDCLTDFGRNLSVPVTLTKAVKGRVRGRVQGRTGGEFLNALAAGNGLIWYYDGAVLHISAESDFATRVLTTKAKGEDVAARMKALGLYDPRFTLRAVDSSVTVSGPPSYIAAVSQVIASQDPVSSGHEVRVHRGGQDMQIVTVPRAAP